MGKQLSAKLCEERTGRESTYLDVLIQRHVKLAVGEYLVFVTVHHNAFKAWPALEATPIIERLESVVDDRQKRTLVRVSVGISNVTIAAPNRG